MWLFGPPDIKKLEKSKKLGRLIKALAYRKDWCVRARAAEALGRLGDRRAVEPLIRALRDADGTVGSDSAKSLGELGDARAVQPLVDALMMGRIGRAPVAEALRDLRAYGAADLLIEAMRQRPSEAVAFALGVMNDARAVEPLIDLLNSNADANSRRTAAEALGKLGDARAVEPLIGVLGSPDYDVRKTAGEALERLGEPRWKGLYRLYAEEHIAALAACGDARAAEPLVRVLWSYDHKAAEAAAQGLAKVGNRGCVEPLIRRLTAKPVDRVTRAVAGALEAIGDVRVVKPLVMALDDDDLCWHAAGVLAAFAEKEPRLLMNEIHAMGEVATTKMRDRLSKSGRRAPVLLACLLSELGDTRATGPIRGLLAAGEPRKRLAAAEALGRLGEPQWSQWVKGDGEDFVRLGASGAPEAVGLLREAMETNDESTRAAAVEGLGLTKALPALQPLIGALEKSTTRETAAAALRALIDSIPKDETTRAACMESLNGLLERHSMIGAELLGRLGDPRAIEPLVKALGGDGPLRQAAAEGLERLGEPQWKQWVQGHPEDFTRLGQSGELRAFEALVAGLGARDAIERQAAADALAAFGDARAVQPLSAAITDPRWSVRRSVAAAIITLLSKSPSTQVPDHSKLTSLFAAPHADSHHDLSWANCNPHNHEDDHTDQGIGLDIPDSTVGADF